MNRYCDNVFKCHDPYVLEEGEVMRVICKECKKHEIIRMEPLKKVPEKRSYIKFFRKFSLQGNTNLFYKYYSQYLSR